MVLNGITLVPLVEDLRYTDPTLLSPFYADDVEFDESEIQSAAQLRLLMNWGPDRGYFPEPYKSLFVSDKPTGGPKSKIRRWRPLPGGLFGVHGGARGMGADQGGGMGS